MNVRLNAVGETASGRTRLLEEINKFLSTKYSVSFVGEHTLDVCDKEEVSEEM